MQDDMPLLNTSVHTIETPFTLREIKFEQLLNSFSCFFHALGITASVSAETPARKSHYLCPCNMKITKARVCLTDTECVDSFCSGNI